MYINFKLMKSRGYTPVDIMVLQMCKQNTSSDPQHEFLEDQVDEETLKSYEKDGLVSFIKGSKKDTIYQKIRITKKGEKILDDLQSYKVEEDDIIVYEWLKNYYKNAGKEIGSEKKGLELCAWFRQTSGITRNNLVKLCKTFINDEERMQFSLVLQYIFWKPESHFHLKPKLEDSKLWLYYEKHREYFDKIFENGPKNR